MRIANSGRPDALLAAVAVVPGEDQDDRAGRSGARASRVCWSCSGQSKVSLTYCETLQEAPRARDVDESPLHHLAAAQPRPDALAYTLCRRVGHSTAPMAVSVVTTGAKANLWRAVSR